MNLAKELMAEQERKEHNKKQGYTKKIINDGTYDMPCPYCGYGLSTDDVKKEQCIHCGHIFNW